jgi:hypothetical protein
VNGLTTAYCQKVAKDNSLSIAQKRSQLNIFSQLAYTEAVVGTIAPPAGGKKASLK